MYHNLEAEMKRFKVLLTDLARCIDKDERTIRNKMSGASSFSINEAWAIRDTFFPQFSIEYLFREIG